MRRVAFLRGRHRLGASVTLVTRVPGGGFRNTTGRTVTGTNIEITRARRCRLYESLAVMSDEDTPSSLPRRDRPRVLSGHVTPVSSKLYRARGQLAARAAVPHGGGFRAYG
jgi:hypothetical protein